MSIKRLLGSEPIAPPPFAFACSPSGLTFAAFERDGGRLVLRELRSGELAAGTFQHGILGGPPREAQAFEERVGAFVSELDTPVHDASLVLPDAWLRTAFAEVDQVPGNGNSREEMLRWKLKRLVPFRVDELRVRAVEVEPVPGQVESHRLLLGFGIETLFSQLEAAFAAAGVHLGRITNRGLSACGSLAAMGHGSGLQGLVLVTEEGYTLVFTLHGEPVLHRYKGLSESLPPEALAGAVRRDLRLSRTFLEDRFPGEEPAPALLAAPEDAAPSWAAWLEDGFEAPVELVSPAHLVPIEVRGDRPAWPELLPLAGAVCQEVAV